MRIGSGHVRVGRVRAGRGGHGRMIAVSPPVVLPLSFSRCRSPPIFALCFRPLYFPSLMSIQRSSHYM